MTGRCSTRSTTPACSRASGRRYRCLMAGTGGSSIGRWTKRTWTASWRTSRRRLKNRCTSRSPTRHGATPHPARELRRPSARPDEWDEGARRSFPDVEASIGLPGRNDQHLSAPRANWGDDAAAGRELKSPRIRDFGSTRRRHDDVVWTALGVPETAISDHHGHARKAAAGKIRPRPFGEPRDPLDRYDLLGPEHVRDERRVVAGPRPNLEDSIARCEPGLFEHDCYHRRCRNRLASPNRERDVVIGRVRILGPDERLPRHREERISHPRILDVPGGDESLHHPKPLRGEIGLLAHRQATTRTRHNDSVTAVPDGRSGPSTGRPSRRGPHTPAFPKPFTPPADPPRMRHCPQLTWPRRPRMFR